MRKRVAFLLSVGISAGAWSVHTHAFSAHHFLATHPHKPLEAIQQDGQEESHKQEASEEVIPIKPVSEDDLDQQQQPDPIIEIDQMY